MKQIKIDQNFIQGMIDNQNDLNIVEGIITLCKAFNLNVIAEGIETSEHIKILLKLGCEFEQGYKIAHPMRQEAILKWIREYKANF